MDREFSSKVENKPVDDRPGRAPPPPRGSGGHGVSEMKANNVLLKYFSTSRTYHRARSERQQRSHRRRSWRRSRDRAHSSPDRGCTLLMHLGSMGFLGPVLLLATVLYNVLFVATVSVATMGP